MADRSEGCPHNGPRVSCKAHMAVSIEIVACLRKYTEKYDKNQWTILRLAGFYVFVNSFLIFGPQVRAQRLSRAASILTF